MQNIRFFAVGICLLLGAYSCQNQTSKTTNVETDTSVQTMDGYVASESDFVITPTTRPNMHVIGKIFPNVKPESLKTLIIGTVAGLNQIIADSNRIIMGPIMAIYGELPVPNAPQTIFVGIPINKPIKNREFGFIELKEGRFHKAKTMAGLGESAPFWSRVADRVKSDGYRVEPPFIEYPSDTRTGEMTSVITYSNLLLPEIKP
jgi:hypothetical protein